MSKIPYDLTKIKGFVFDVDGVLSPACIPLGHDGLPQRMVNIKDGYAIQLAVKHGYKFAIITGGTCNAIKLRFEGLGIRDIYMGSAMKIDILKEWLSKNDLTPDQIAYAGDDIPDYNCMQLAGLSVAPRDAAIDIKNIATYIAPCNGGEGIARDIIEETMKAQGQWMNNEKAFGW